MMTLLLIIIYVSFISLGLPDSLLGSAWPAMQHDFAVPVSYAGIVSMIIAGGTIVSSFFSDSVIRKWGTGFVTTISVLMTAVALLGFGIAPSFIWLCVLAIPLGLGAGSVDAALNNFVALHYKAKHMNWLHSFWGIGATAGPAIMSMYLIGDSNWNMGYLTIGFIQISLVVILILTIPLWRRATPAAAAPGEEGSAVAIMKRSDMLKIKGMKPALIAFFTYCALEATAGLWGSSFLVIHRGISAETAAKWISLFYLGITLGRIASGFMTTKLNNVTMIRLGLGGIAVGVLSLLLPIGDFVFPIGLLLIGLGCAPIYPSMLHQTPHNFGKELSQSVMGVQMASAYVGATLMPPLFGLIAEHVNIAWFPYFLMAILLLMIFMSEKTNRAVAERLHAKLT
ncbi:MAG: MFS transporter [Candidatus Cohnella colombiensis]|uniref:MFS transporter n=1 Tax=Candidatus Cohnella colombiensis TaxID=3121368 RepID=A0AA95EW18_9BACL|nr:MAG: MFS transporter [Cohnella sp.]